LNASYHYLFIITHHFKNTNNYGRHSRKPRKIQKEKIKVLDEHYSKTLILS